MADKSFDTKARKEELAGEFGRKMEDRKAALMARLSNKAWAFLDHRSYSNRVPALQGAFEEALRRGTVPSEYICTHMGWFLEHLIPAGEREGFLTYLDGIRDYSYSIGYGRRSYRSVSYALYADQIMHILRNSMREACFRLTPADCLLRRLPEDAQAYIDSNCWGYCGYTDSQITRLLDAHDPATEEAVRAVLTSEVGGAVTHSLIRGVLRSHRPEFYELAGKLLLAARLQEGVRQVICESADCGTREGFLAILRVIEENNLIRFSSVKRAVGTWLGLLSDEERNLERVSNKSVQLILDYLDDPKARAAALSGEDAMEIYIALWAYAFDSVETATQEVQRLAATGSHHQVLVAGYFVRQLDDPLTAHKTALRVVLAKGGEADTLAVWLPQVLSYRGGLVARKQNAEPWQRYFADAAEAYDLAALMERQLLDFQGKERVFSPCVFPWFEAKIQKCELAEVYCTVASMLKTPMLMDKACSLIKECSPNMRSLFVEPLLSPPKGAIQRKTLLETIVDKESYTRRKAWGLIRGIQLTEEENRVLEGYLRFKADDIRTEVIDLLLRQNNDALRMTVGRLLDSDKEEMRLGGLDLLTRIKADKKRESLVAAFIPRLSARLAEGKVTSKEQILLETFVPKETETSDESGALYELGDMYLPDVTDDGLMPEDFPAMVKEAVALLARCFPDGEIESLIYGKKRSFFDAIKNTFGGKGNGKPCATAKEAEADLLALSAFITEHLHDMVTPLSVPAVPDPKPVMLGELAYAFRYEPRNERSRSIPAAGLWDTWAEEHGMTDERIVRACVRCHAPTKKHSFETDAAPLLAGLYGAGYDEPIDLPEIPKIIQVLRYLLDGVPTAERERLGAGLGLWFMRCVPDHMVLTGGSKKKEHLLTHDQLYLLFSLMTCRTKELLPLTFPVSVAVAERCMAAYEKTPAEELGTSEWSDQIYYANRPGRMLYANDIHRPYAYRLVGEDAYIRAVHYGIISDAQFFEFALRPSVLDGALKTLTSLSAEYIDKGRAVTVRGEGGIWAGIHRRNALLDMLGEGEQADKDSDALLACAHRLCERLLPVVLEPEYKRGDSEAAYSKYIHSIERVTGAGHLVRILEALGNDTLNRNDYYWHDHTPGRNATLTHLLSVCVPDANDTVDGLRQTLAGKKITEKRLIEAALYAPEWIPLIGEYLEIQSFESVCYYFIAHMNERFDDKRRAVIARYTPLDEEELNGGAFDRAWFESAYAAVGEKRFNLIYGAAKYISDGAKHARARKYADACLGKYTTAELETAISDKRNKDLLMAYALIPPAGEDDICHRYLYIGQFKKESRSFGSQRAASEAKAADMALKNLSQTAGYSDTMRLTLRMEIKLMDDRRELMRQHDIDGVIIEPVIGEDGKTELSIKKDGKALKSIPAKLKKNETVLALTELKKALTEQYRRTRLMLEEAMECESAFTMEEISALLAHPVVHPMLVRLVFVCGDTCGFATENGIRSADGVEHVLPPDASLMVAHPYTLFKLGVWRDYQAYLYEHKLVQPYRQVFRELYIKTADEHGALNTLRYAGHQIQPAKTVSVLKGRRWVADVENGLQKVYYKENIVARMYAMADWFSPADIEAPTLEWVEFVDRHTGKAIPIDDIPDILFSEVMRDVDLAVSVAHVGGVDPEASHSTVEMREAILSFILPMLRLNNVKVEKGRAVIDGALAEYTVHLGSGVVHQIGGAMIPVLPVHSQHRGQVFLPFADDDPKTAEIISKVILFAEDKKIRDPMILSGIVKK